MSTPNTSNPCQDCPHASVVLTTMLQMPTTAAALAARVAVLESKLERQEELGMAAGDLSSMVGG